MVCTLIGAIINTILDPLFIFGFKWGIKGGAWATVIGQFISAMLVVLYFAKFRHMHLEKGMFKPQMTHLKAISSLGLASCINQIAIGAVQIVMNNTLRYYGASSVYGSDIPIACVGIIVLFLSFDYIKTDHKIRYLLSQRLILWRSFPQNHLL